MSAENAGEFIDLSFPLCPDMPVFPGLRPPEVSVAFSHEDSAASGRYIDCTCMITDVTMSGSIGTRLDVPLHFSPDGADAADVALSDVIADGVCLDARDAESQGEIDVPSLLQGVDAAGKAVLICTGWDRHYGTEEYARHPFVGRGGTRALLQARLVGIDTLLIDDRRDARRPAHSGLLTRGVLIVEQLRGLERLLDVAFRFFAVPPKVRGMSAFPVRAFADLV
ncbi:MAG: cyclase family protein [Armatimonadota bacterium]